MSSYLHNVCIRALGIYVEVILIQNKAYGMSETKYCEVCAGIKCSSIIVKRGGLNLYVSFRK